MKDSNLILYIFGLTALASVAAAIFLERFSTEDLRKKAPFPDHLEIKVVTDRWTGVQYYLDGRGGLTRRALQP